MFFHAHPDDEALLTAGTMAMLAAEGHRVVLVVATLGDQGLAAPEALGHRRLDEVRSAELAASARTLGCARVVFLGYQDSGWGWPPGDGRAVGSATPPAPSGEAVAFAEADIEQVAGKLAALLRDERADLVTIYDPAGGYGHPDHVQVYRVGTRAAALAGTPVVLQATFDRTLLMRVLRLVAPLRRFLPEFDLAAYGRAYTLGRLITHRVDVRHHLDAKRRSLAAHVSQAAGSDSVRTLALLLRLPRPLFRRFLGTEYYVQLGANPARPFRHPLDTR